MVSPALVISLTSASALGALVVIDSHRCALLREVPEIEAPIRASHR
jgi:hypothetical protein